jgi:hypothetical protein
MQKLTSKGQEGQAVGWSPIGQQDSNKIIQRTRMNHKMLLLGHFYSPVPKKELLSLEVLTSYSGLS